LLGLGSVSLIGCLLVGNELGQGFRQRTWDGGVAHAAVPTLSPAANGPLRPGVLPACLGLIGAGAWLASLRRRYFWIVTQPAADGRADVWLAGASWRHEAAFETEFGELLERTRQKQLELEPPAGKSAT
jgi:hypothetical protein